MKIFSTLLVTSFTFIFSPCDIVGCVILCLCFYGYLASVNPHLPVGAPSRLCTKRLLHTFAFLVCNNILRFTASNSVHTIKNQP